MLDVGGDHHSLVGELFNAQILNPGEVAGALALPDLGRSCAGQTKTA